MREKGEELRNAALQMFLEHKGKITNHEISRLLEVDERVIGVWKHRYKWQEVLVNNLEKSPEDIATAATSSTVDREAERASILEKLHATDSYSPALDLMIELYLDCYEEYISAKENELSTVGLRKELKMLLKDLGLSANNRSIKKKDEITSAPIEQGESKLVQFRRQVSK